MTALPDLTSLAAPRPTGATLVGRYGGGRRGSNSPPSMSVKILQADGARGAVRCVFRYRALSLPETARDVAPAGMAARRDELVGAVENAYDYLARAEEVLRNRRDVQRVVLTPGPRYDANAAADDGGNLWRRVFWVLDVGFAGEDFDGADGDARFSDVADALSRTLAELHNGTVDAFELDEDFDDLNEADLEVLEWYEGQLG